MDRRQPAEFTQNNTTENNERSTNKVRRYSLAQKLSAVAAGITLAGSLAACGENANANPAETPKPAATATETVTQPTPTPEVTEATPAEVPTPSEVIKDTDDLPEDWVHTGIYEYLDAETQASIDSLAGMDIATFRQQPVEARTSFADYVVYNATPYADSWLDNKGIDVEYTRNPQTAQEISDNNFYNFVVASHLTTYVPTDDGGMMASFDYLTAQKIASANILSEVDYAEWDTYINSIDSTTTPGVQVSYDLLYGTVTSETLSPEGNIVYEYTTKQDSTPRQIVTQPVTFTSLTGDGQQYTAYIGQ